jgi:hypothetical protein
MLLLQLRVLGFDAVEDGNVRVGALPQSDEVLVRRFRVGCVVLQGVSAAQAEVREGADRIAEDNPTMVKNLLEFRGGFRALMCRQVRLAAHIGRVEAAKEKIEVDPSMPSS